MVPSVFRRVSKKREDGDSAPTHRGECDGAGAEFLRFYSQKTRLEKESDSARFDVAPRGESTNQTSRWMREVGKIRYLSHSNITQIPSTTRKQSENNRPLIGSIRKRPVGRCHPNVQPCGEEVVKEGEGKPLR